MNSVGKMMTQLVSEQFVGEQGVDWNVRPGALGPPDKITDIGTQNWLLVPGPPMSCYLMYQAADPKPERWGFYHKHPDVYSIHIVMAGQGVAYEDGKRFDLKAGDTIYHGPNVYHSIGPAPGHDFTVMVVQFPHIGHSKGQWQICPEAGTTDDFMNRAAFHQRFGDNPTKAELIGKVLYMSERWRSVSE